MVKKIKRYVVLVAIVIGAIFEWRLVGVPPGWEKVSLWGINPFGLAWLATGFTLFVLMGTIRLRLREKWLARTAADILGRRITSHDMGGSRFPLWFLRWQGHHLPSILCSILIFLFPFFLAGYVWWILDWKDIGKTTVLVALMWTMFKWFAYWQPLGKEEAFKRADPTNRENGNPIRPDSLARFGLLVLAALQGHEKAKRDLKTMLCQGGLDEPAPRDSDG